MGQFYSPHTEAREIYRESGKLVDALVKSGKIAAKDRDAAFAKIVSKMLSRSGIPVSKEMAKNAGTTTVKTGSASLSPTAQAIGNSAAGVTKTTLTQVAKGALQSGAPVAGAFFVAEGIHTLYQYSSGRIDGAEAGRRAVESAASNTGGLGMAAAGAALGTIVFPGVGTTIGFIVGGIGGGYWFRKLCRKLTRRKSAN